MRRVLGLVLLAVVSARAQVTLLAGSELEMAEVPGTCGAIWKSTGLSSPVYTSGNGSCAGISLRLPSGKLAVAYNVKEKTDGIAPGAYVQVFTGDVPGPRRQLAACGHADTPAIAMTRTGDQFVVACVSAAQTAVVAQTYVGDAAPGGSSFIVGETFSDNVTEPAIATFADGTFAVSWLDHGSSLSTLRARRCTADGNRCFDPIVELYSGALLRYHSSSSNEDRVVFTVLHHYLLNGWNMIARFADLMVRDRDPVPLAYIPNLSDLYTAQTVLVYGSGFLVAWTGVDGSGEGVNTRLFLHNGTAFGDTIEANRPTEDAQYHPVLFGPVSGSGSMHQAALMYSSLASGTFSTYHSILLVKFPEPPPGGAPESPAPSTAAPEESPSPGSSAPQTGSPAGFPDTPAPETASPGRRDASADDDDQLPPGAIAGIVVGGLAVVLVVAAAVVWFTRAPAQRVNSGGKEKQLPPPHEGKEMEFTEPAVHSRA
ncbi:hypothetical protein DIPPA_28353 [Diplonema papillatum]|nr:hypothetical protein DIPPA_28353 [Diplonema papillatum]